MPAQSHFHTMRFCLPSARFSPLESCGRTRTVGGAGRSGAGRGGAGRVGGREGTNQRTKQCVEINIKTEGGGGCFCVLFRKVLVAADGVFVEQWSITKLTFTNNTTTTSVCTQVLTLLSRILSSCEAAMKMKELGDGGWWCRESRIFCGGIPQARKKYGIACVVQNSNLSFRLHRLVHICTCIIPLFPFLHGTGYSTYCLLSTVYLPGSIYTW